MKKIFLVFILVFNAVALDHFRLNSLCANASKQRECLAYLVDASKKNAILQSDFYVLRRLCLFQNSAPACIYGASVKKPATPMDARSMLELAMKNCTLPPQAIDERTNTHFICADYANAALAIGEKAKARQLSQIACKAGNQFGCDLFRKLSSSSTQSSAKPGKIEQLKASAANEDWLAKTATSKQTYNEHRAAAHSLRARAWVLQNCRSAEVGEQMIKELQDFLYR